MSFFTSEKTIRDVNMGQVAPSVCSFENGRLLQSVGADNT